MNEETKLAEKATVVRLRDKELVEQIGTRARSAILTWLRENQQVIFWASSMGTSFSAYHLGRFLGYGRSDKLDLDSVARMLAHQSPLKFRTFEASWSANDGQHSRVSVQLKEKFEWTDVLAEAWKGLQRPAGNLSEPLEKYSPGPRKPGIKATGPTGWRLAARRNCAAPAGHPSSSAASARRSA